MILKRLALIKFLDIPLEELKNLDLECFFKKLNATGINNIPNLSKYALIKRKYVKIKIN